MDQITIFDFLNDSTELVITPKVKKESKYTYVNPKKEKEVPREYIINVVLRGSGFVGGKKRIYELFQAESNAAERTKRIKNEYGLGGAGWPIEGYGIHGYDSFSTQGLRFQWRDEEGEKEGYISWSVVEKEIQELIRSNEYYRKERGKEIE